MQKRQEERVGPIKMTLWPRVTSTAINITDTWLLNWCPTRHEINLANDLHCFFGYKEKKNSSHSHQWPQSGPTNGDCRQNIFNVITESNFGPNLETAPHLLRLSNNNIIGTLPDFGRWRFYCVIPISSTACLSLYSFICQTMA